jgi:hypothetical protein
LSPPQAGCRLERSAAQCGLEKPFPALDILGNELEKIAHVLLDARPFPLESLREEEPLGDVQLIESPGIDVRPDVVLEEPIVQERRLELLREIRPHDLAEEPGILLEQEEIELVAGVLRVLRELLLPRQPGPIGDEAELRQRRVAAHRGEEAQSFADRVVDLELRGGGVLEHEILIGLEEADLAPLGVVLPRVQSRDEPQVARRGGDVGE